MMHDEMMCNQIHRGQCVCPLGSVAPSEKDEALLSDF